MTEAVFLEDGKTLQIATSDGEIYSKILQASPSKEFQEEIIQRAIEHFDTTSSKSHFGLVADKMVRDNLLSHIIPLMTRARFLENGSIVEVIIPDGEKFTIKPTLPIPEEKQIGIAQAFALYFEEYFEDDKGSMMYNIFLKMWDKCTFSCIGSSKNEERIRIGQRIKELRESKKMEAKGLAVLANIDVANLSRIEHGSYSVGFDILSRLAYVLDAKIDLIPNETQKEQ